MNRYAYVEGAPESFVDVLGFFRAAAAIQAQKLAALSAAFEAAFADLNRVVASQARLPGARTVKQMMASYNMFHASDDPVVRAAMDQIAREAFYGVTQQKYQAKVQVAFQEQAAKAQAQAQARYAVAAAVQTATAVQANARAQAEAAAAAKENRPWYEKSLSIFGDTAKTFASDAWGVAVASVEHSQLGEIIKFVAAPDFYFDEKKEQLSASWDTMTWAATHPVEAYVFVNVELPKLVVESVWAPIRDCWNAGDYGCAVGHALFDVTLAASMFADGVGIPAAAVKVETSLIEAEAALARAEALVARAETTAVKLDAATSLASARAPAHIEAFGLKNAEGATEMVIGPYAEGMPYHYITVAEGREAMYFDLGPNWTNVNGPVNNNAAIQLAIESHVPVHSTVSVTELWVLRARQAAAGQDVTGNSLLTEWQALRDAGYVWSDPLP